MPSLQGSPPTATLTVCLAAVPDPHSGQTVQNYSVPTRTTYVNNIREAQRACRRYIEEHELRGSNWAGGQIRDALGRLIARISYNCRAWEPGTWPTLEIKLDLDGAPLL